MYRASPITSEYSRVTVGIVTYNSSDHIGPCLDSVAKNLKDASPTVIVLDNASEDNTLEVLSRLEKKYPFSLHTIPQGVNHGYAWGANRIAQLAGCEWLCFVNPDARLLTGAFQHAKDLIRTHPTCGVIGGILTDPDGRPQECGGVFPTPLMAVWDWCGLRHLIPRSRWSTTVKLNLPEDRAPRRIDYPTGAFWFMRREVFERTGPFDERFFLYFEETDFCLRAKKKGWSSFVHPAIRVEHHRGGSTFHQPGSASSDMLGIYFESLVYYLYKHFPSWRVENALRTIHNFLRVRKAILKNEKSERIYEAFEEGRSKAEKHLPTADS